MRRSSSSPPPLPPPFDAHSARARLLSLLRARARASGRRSAAPFDVCISGGRQPSRRATHLRSFVVVVIVVVGDNDAPCAPANALATVDPVRKLAASPLSVLQSSSSSKMRATTCAKEKKNDRGYNRDHIDRLALAAVQNCAYKNENAERRKKCAQKTTRKRTHNKNSALARSQINDLLTKLFECSDEKRAQAEVAKICASSIGIQWIRPFFCVHANFICAAKILPTMSGSCASSNAIDNYDGR